MKIKTIIGAVALLLMMTASVFGQGISSGIVVCEPKDGYAQTRALTTDSSSFFSSFIFDIPEGVRSDTLQLMMYVESSTYSNVDLNISSFFGFKKAGRLGRASSYYGWEPDSTIVKDNLAYADTLYSFMIVPAADDTLDNSTIGMQTWHEAVKINIQSGGTGNGSDVDFWMKLVGQQDNERAH